MYDLISLIITADSFRLQLSFYFIFYIFLKHFFLFSRNMPIPSDPHSFALTVKMHNWFNGFIFYFECLSKCRQMCFSARDFQSKKKKNLVRTFPCWHTLECRALAYFSDHNADYSIEKDFGMFSNVKCPFWAQEPI